MTDGMATARREDVTGDAAARIGWRQRAEAALGTTLAAGRMAYCREKTLPRLLPIGPRELAEQGPEADRRIVARLARALRAERNRGRAGHWTYDLNRHIALHQAYLAERARLGGLRGVAGARAGSPPPAGTAR
ncbi:hypothetical protein [Prosthecomicrobium pneumaticum]|uniref:Uncharacterized protein n=1 Tax=Prosthecomicrobium pneumaticum TaxID=81895 RepID=A0A7W9CUP8_9HYPH|nr:hypothetical protein [Prosthecomicrobium pneumaticum]MBB5751712.1 hypothetical protein [Prosthecomicrobium pneumaticum]